MPQAGYLADRLDPPLVLFVAHCLGPKPPAIAATVPTTDLSKIRGSVRGSYPYIAPGFPASTQIGICLTHSRINSHVA